VSFQKASLSVMGTLCMPSAVLCLHAATVGDTSFLLVGCASPSMLYVYRINKIDKTLMVMMQEKEVCRDVLWVHVCCSERQGERHRQQEGK
jgi:hypothetical protein